MVSKTIYTVFPQDYDPDCESCYLPQDFDSEFEAKEYAAGLDCSYVIEETKGVLV